MGAITEVTTSISFSKKLATFLAFIIEQLRVTPKESFLQSNQSVTLVWRYQSEDLKEHPFTQNFIFYNNDQLMDNEGGDATVAYFGKPYVDYKMEVKKPGIFTGEVGQLRSIAHVYGIDYESDILVAKSGDNLVLNCEGGRKGTVKDWQVDGVPVDKAKLENFIVTYDGSLLIQNIDFNDALRKISCRQFLSEDDLFLYKTNSLGLLAYKTAVTIKPVLVYETVEKPESMYAVQVASWKEGIVIQTCFQQDGNDVCKETTANITMELNRKNSNFTILMGNVSLISDSFKGSEKPAEEKQLPEESDSPVGIIVGVAVGVVAVVGIVIFTVIIRLKKKLCFAESVVSKEDEAGMKPLVPKDEKNGIQDAIELKELDKKEPVDEKQPALEELEAMEDEEVNPLLLDNYQKKEVREPEKFDLWVPKYLKNKSKTSEDGDELDAKINTEEKEKQIEKDAYDLLMEPNAQQSWDQFRLVASKIDDFLETHLKIPEKPGSDISESLFRAGKDILPRGFVSYVSSSKGNCLFNSASSVLYGNEDYTNRLRLAALLHGINNCDFYIKQYFKDKDKDSIHKFMKSSFSEESLKHVSTSSEDNEANLAEFVVQTAVREMAIPDSRCNPLQVQFLSSAIDLPVLQYFQKGYHDFYGKPVKDYEVVKPAGMTGSVKEQHKECVCVLWVCESQKIEADGGRLDYVVPVLKKRGGLSGSIMFISTYKEVPLIAVCSVWNIVGFAELHKH